MAQKGEASEFMSMDRVEPRQLIQAMGGKAVDFSRPVEESPQVKLSDEQSVSVTDNEQ